jgi:C4-type Zn-finger protein
MSDIKKLQEMHTTLLELKEESITNPVTLELLDPNGHSQIIHGDATLRELTVDELNQLPTSPEPPIFNSEDMVE